MDALIQALVQANFPPERIIPRASMARYTSFRVGGEADVLVNIGSAEDISAALRAARRAGVPVTVIGNGSNLLVRDGGIRGVVLRVGRHMADIRVQGEQIEAQAGATLSALAQAAARANLAGVAALSGIPGTLGGAAVMNAGAYGGEMSQVITSVSAVALSDGKPLTFRGAHLGYGYRHSAMMEAGIIICEVTMALTPADPQAIRERMQELSRMRLDKQPLEYPSAGSTFKRPKDHFAAKLIDDCGLRGLRIGDAQVSEKHAGFIINRGHATASDILALMHEVTHRVEEATGIHLEPEVRILGEDAPSAS